MTGHLVSHIVRRGVQHFSQRDAYVEQLQHDAQLYENEGKPVDPAWLLPVVITSILALLVIWSIDYTIGQVMSSLAMIESPSATAIIESKPPAYADEPDAPLEKEPLMPSEAEADVEVTVINHKPITAKITTTIGHLHRVGGFTARWRGLGMAVFYHFLHATGTNLFALVFRFGVAGEMLAYVLTSVALCRVHMAWTQKMVTYPSKQWWFRRLPSRKECKALLLPSLVYAVAEQATLALPAGVAFALGLVGDNQPHWIADDGNSTHANCSKAVLLVLKFLAVPTTYVAVAFLILLPASVTLTRIEAALLPEGDETIVPFDKAAVVGEADLSGRRGRRALFVEAWRSFDRSSRWRLIKLYAKMFLAQFTVAIIAIHLVVAELFVIGHERMALLIKSGVAQLKLMAIDAQENAQ